MNPRLLLVLVACTASAPAQEISAPSTLPGQGATVPIQVAPPVALPMPVFKPPKTAPSSGMGNETDTGMNDTLPANMPLPKRNSKGDLLDAREPRAIRGEAAPLPAKPGLAPVSSKATSAKTAPGVAKKRGALAQVRVEGTALGTTLNVDIARANQMLAQRYATLSLDETDRDTLKLDREIFRELNAAAIPAQIRASGAEVKQLMGAPGGNVAPIKLTKEAKANSTRHVLGDAVFCKTQFNNLPKITRVLVDNKDLVPGIAFALKGVCLGDQPGAVMVHLGPPNASRVYQARIAGWASGKIHAILPENIEGVPPVIAEIVVTTADRRTASPAYFGFEPRWVTRELFPAFSNTQLIACDNGGPDGLLPLPQSMCDGAKKQRSPGYEEYSKWPHKLATGVHYTAEDIEVRPVSGTDKWRFTFPPGGELVNWAMEIETFEGTKNTAVSRWNPQTRTVDINWRMAEIGDEGFLRYSIDRFTVKFPAGM